MNVNREASARTAQPVRAAQRVESTPMSQAGGGRRVWDLTGYQWTVLFAAWLGWGFDVFDGLLFNFVAPNCVPTLLGLPIGSPEARSATLFWTGVLTSLLLIGWAIGGIIFGKVADRIGRTRTLLLTMLIYAVGTALCAFAPNIWMLAAFRFVASLGIGGEWAAGAVDGRRGGAREAPRRGRRAALHLGAVRAVPGHLRQLRRSPAGCSRIIPRSSWRYVFLSGLIPAGGGARSSGSSCKEPERWVSDAGQARRRGSPSCSRAAVRPRDASAASSWRSPRWSPWWSCNAFIPVIASGLAQRRGGRAGARPGGDAGAGRELEGARHQLVQHRRPDRHAADRAGRQVHGPPPDVRDLLRRRRRSR